TLRLEADELALHRHCPADRHGDKVDKGECRKKRTQFFAPLHHRRRHQTTHPSATTKSGNATTTVMKTMLSCRPVSAMSGGSGEGGGEGGWGLPACEPAHRREEEVAVRHIRKKRVAGEVAVTDHDGTHRPDSIIEMPFHSDTKDPRPDDRGRCCPLDARGIGWRS